MKLSFFILVLFISHSLAAPSSELLYNDQSCGGEEQVGSATSINSASECETACYNRYLTNNDCFFYSYYAGDFFCTLFTTCDTVGSSIGAATYEMTPSTDAPTESPTQAPLDPCDCLNGGTCVNGTCHCIYPNFGSNCEQQRDCSCP
jgi:hypothetical protein